MILNSGNLPFNLVQIKARPKSRRLALALRLSSCNRVVYRCALCGRLDETSFLKVLVRCDCDFSLSLQVTNSGSCWSYIHSSTISLSRRPSFQSTWTGHGLVSRQVQNSYFPWMNSTTYVSILVRTKNFLTSYNLCAHFILVLTSTTQRFIRFTYF